jgi:hypothetical protein
MAEPGADRHRVEAVTNSTVQHHRARIRETGDHSAVRRLPALKTSQQAVQLRAYQQLIRGMQEAVPPAPSTTLGVIESQPQAEGRRGRLAQATNRQALERLVASVGRFLDPGRALAASADGPEFTESSRWAAAPGCWTRCGHAWESGRCHAGC